MSALVACSSTSASSSALAQTAPTSASLAPALPAARSAEPVNPHATERTRAVLAYLAGLEHLDGGRVLSGQFTGFHSQGGKYLLKKIHEQTGQWPAVVGVDYADFERAGLSVEPQNETAIAYWREGGLVTVSAHLYNPANPLGGGLRDKGVDLDELLKPGTDTHRRWMKQLSIIAKGLGELQDEGIVVLWRPFHEMNGGWFWWGAKEPESFKRVWRHMYDYFTTTKKLNNLLWVYGPNHGKNTGDYYPGDDVVDITGFDAYTDHVDPKHIHGYEALAALPKPTGFSEFGPFGSQNPPGDFDFCRLLEGMRTHFPRASYFLCWDENWSPANNLNAKLLYQDKRVLNRGDLPPALTGR